jgi:hypothetical protein
VHGCPYYGPAVYDAEGFNQEGYHRITGRNREGYTRLEQGRVDRGEYEETDDEDDEDDDEEEDSEDEEDHPALQYVDPDVRTAFAAMGRDERDTFLVILQISLSEQQNLIFDNSNALTGDQETFGGGGIDGDADWESDSSHSDSSGGAQEGEEPASLGLELEEALQIDGSHDDNVTADEDGDEDRLDIGWARPPGSWPMEEEM